jgi:hypothetical protein
MSKASSKLADQKSNGVRGRDGGVGRGKAASRLSRDRALVTLWNSNPVKFTTIFTVLFTRFSLSSFREFHPNFT